MSFQQQPADLKKREATKRIPMSLARSKGVGFDVHAVYKAPKSAVPSSADAPPDTCKRSAYRYISYPKTNTEIPIASESPILCPFTIANMAKLHVAIIGGGIGGATLARALLKYPDITFDLYEYKSDFSDQGAAVSLANSALQSLVLWPSDVVAHIEQGNGPEARDAKPNTMDGAYQVNVSRPKLLQSVLAGIPKKHLHTAKKLLRVEQSSADATTRHKVTLFFDDESTATADAVVGVDGIHSTVRKIILGQDHPALDPVYAGFWWCHNKLEYKKASSMMDGFEIPLGLLSIYGQDGFLMCLCIDNGEQAAPYAIGMTEKWEDKSWSRVMSKEEFHDYFAQWNKVSQDVVNMVAEQPEITIYSEWESAIAPTYCKDNICMAGDVRLALPFHSLVISKLLNLAKGPEEVPSAFRAYEQVRMPRTQGIIKASREIGNIFCGKIPEIGLDAMKMAPLLIEKAMFMRGIDMEIHVNDAIARFEQGKSSLCSCSLELPAVQESRSSGPVTSSYSASMWSKSHVLWFCSDVALCLHLVRCAALVADRLYWTCLPLNEAIASGRPASFRHCPSSPLEPGTHPVWKAATMRFPRPYVFVIALLSSHEAQCQKGEDILSFIDPLIGTVNGGHVFAGASLPFSMAKAVADVAGENQGGFASDGSDITGFSHMHDSGTGGVSLAIPFRSRM
nr:6-methylsalicylic acid decarboxylase ata [Quercus suber]